MGCSFIRSNKVQRIPFIIKNLVIEWCSDGYPGRKPQSPDLVLVMLVVHEATVVVADAFG